MIELEQNKQHLIIKRNGQTEEYDPSKMRRVIYWATQENDILTNEILNAIDIRIYNKIHIATLYDEVIDTVYNMISRLTPQYEEVAKRLYLQKMYKETWQMKRQEYPSYIQVLDKLIGNKSIIQILDILSEDEIMHLSDAIEPSRDLLSSYLGLTVYFEKYSFNIQNQPVELLQHGFMRMAIQGFLYDDSPQRVDKIISRYNFLSLGYFTEATPKWLNSLTYKPQMASCVVHKADDSSNSINKSVSDIGQYSRAGGGNAIDMSSLRCKGSTIGSKGASSGPVPFIKLIQGSVNAYNQLSARPGICAIYYPWWHADVMSLVPLMDEGGKESQRARSLKYAIKINRYFLRAIENGEDIHLFDPKDVPELNTLVGSAFDEKYKWAIANIQSKQVIPAQDLAYAIATERVNTGNIYIFFIENSNENTPFNDIINSSNICMEINLPTQSAKHYEPTLQEDLSTGRTTTIDQYETGLTALCNLSSINVDTWMDLSLSQRAQLASNLLEASDNLIDWQYYPTKDGELFNRNYRAIGIGMNNLAYYFAKHNIKFSSEEAKEHMTRISVSIRDTFIQASTDLAKLRGNFKWHHKTNLTIPQRFATLFAIAPTSTSSLIINATEGIEPIGKLIKEKTGTYSSKQLAPELAEYGTNYELAFTIPTKSLYDLAAIREEILLDQGQSINTYYLDITSSKQIWDDIIYAESIGLKSLYYLQTSTGAEQEACDSCGS